jgi:adenosine deaminase
MIVAPPHPLDDVPRFPHTATLPKADLHIHAEADARIERVLARRAGRAPYDWRGWAARLLKETAPGMPRLERMGANRCAEPAVVDALDANDEIFVARVADLLEQGAADGAVLIEVLFGGATILRPDFMSLFRAAERQVQQRYPRLCAEALIAARSQHPEWEARLLPACLAAAREGLAGINILPDPYDQEADWSGVGRWAERVAAAGLGIAAHAGEFSTANIAAALRVPGLTRLGHGVYIAHDPRLLELAARSGVTVECCLTCNVVLGAVESYAAHPLRELRAHNIPCTLNTDDPLRVVTTIGREYDVAAALGFSPHELLDLTRNAVRASFAPPARRAALLDELRVK